MDGRGYRVEDTNYWVNPDLCRSDQEARYFVREERWKRSQMREDTFQKGMKKTAAPTVNVKA